MSPPVEKSEPKQGPPRPPHRWKKGQSGNPKGKPKGARNAVLKALDAISEAGSKAALRAMVKAAAKGDVSAARLVLDQIIPPRKDRPVIFPLPALDVPGGPGRAMAAICAGVATGQLTPSEADDFSRMVARYVETITADEVVKRIEAIEAMQGRTI